MAELSKITDIISELKKQNKNEPDVKLTRLEIIFMEILQVLKTNLEEMKSRAALERTFQEEKDYEDERRHREFIEVLKRFVSIEKPPTIIEEEKKEESGFLDSLKNFLLKIVDTFKGLIKGVFSVLGKLAKFTALLSKKIVQLFKKAFNILRSPAVLRFLSGLVRGLTPYALIYGAYEALNYIVRAMPDYSKINPYEAEAILENATPNQIKDFADKVPKEFIDRIKQETGKTELLPREILETYVREAKQQRKLDLQRKFDREGTLSDAEYNELLQLENKPIVPVITPTQLPRVPPRPPEGGSNARAMEWDRKYGGTHNRDGTPKIQTPSQPVQQFNVTPSGVGAGRGGESEMNDYRARQLESSGQTGAVFGVFPRARSAAPVAPVIPRAQPMRYNNKLNEMLLNATMLNNDLNLRNTLSTGDLISTVNNNGNSSVLPDIPLSVEASQRDDTPTLLYVMKRYKQLYV